jgi:hypothetical protein
VVDDQGQVLVVLAPGDPAALLERIAARAHQVVVLGYVPYRWNSRSIGPSPALQRYEPAGPGRRRLAGMDLRVVTARRGIGLIRRGSELRASLALALCQAEPAAEGLRCRPVGRRTDMDRVVSPAEPTFLSTR